MESEPELETDRKLEMWMEVEDYKQEVKFDNDEEFLRWWKR